MATSSKPGSGGSLIPPQRGTGKKAPKSKGGKKGK